MAPSVCKHSKHSRARVKQAARQDSRRGSAKEHSRADRRTRYPARRRTALRRRGGARTAPEEMEGRVRPPWRSSPAPRFGGAIGAGRALHSAATRSSWHKLSAMRSKSSFQSRIDAFPFEIDAKEEREESQDAAATMLTGWVDRDIDGHVRTRLKGIFLIITGLHALHGHTGPWRGTAATQRGVLLRFGIGTSRRGAQRLVPARLRCVPGSQQPPGSLVAPWLPPPSLHDVPEGAWPFSLRRQGAQITQESVGGGGRRRAPGESAGVADFSSAAPPMVCVFFRSKK